MDTCVAYSWSAPRGRKALDRLRRWGKDIHVKLLVKHRQVLLRSYRKRFCRHRRRNPIIFGRMIAQSLAQRRRHQTGITRPGQQMLQASQQFITTGELSGQPGTKKATQGNEVLPTQFLN